MNLMSDMFFSCFLQHKLRCPDALIFSRRWGTNSSCPRAAMNPFVKRSLGCWCWTLRPWAAWQGWFSGLVKQSVFFLVWSFNCFLRFGSRLWSNNFAVPGLLTGPFSGQSWSNLRNKNEGVLEDNKVYEEVAGLKLPEELWVESIDVSTQSSCNKSGFFNDWFLVDFLGICEEANFVICIDMYFKNYRNASHHVPPKHAGKDAVQTLLKHEIEANVVWCWAHLFFFFGLIQLHQVTRSCWTLATRTELEDRWQMHANAAEHSYPEISWNFRMDQNGTCLGDLNVEMRRRFFPIIYFMVLS